MNNSTKPGPVSNVTAALVERVSRLVAKGIPIRVALEGEPVTPAAYKKQLQRHPELAAIQSTAKIKFLDTATDMIFSRPNPLVRWLLERRHSDIFGPNHKDDPDSEAASAPKTQTQTIAGIPEYLLEQARKNDEKF
ncbi:MAG: hypothetical protein ACREE6_14755 [Limisphaerales bacterium]